MPGGVQFSGGSKRIFLSVWTDMGPHVQRVTFRGSGTQGCPLVGTHGVERPGY